MSHGPAPRDILVYETTSHRLVATLKYSWQYGCAFSPDSSELAVLSSGTLELFSLPQPDK
jgi:hypothetical protein